MAARNGEVRRHKGDLKMNTRWRAALCKVLAASVAGVAIYNLTPSKAQELEALQEREHNAALSGASQLSIEHPECTFFGPERERFLPRISQGGGFAAGRLTGQFQAAIATRGPRAGRTRPFSALTSRSNLIDQDIHADLLANNVTPADKTTDYEFIRRVTLDLTGRIPTAARVISFVASVDPDKRAALVEELLAKPEWVDKWTMYFGDLYKNTAATVQIQIRPEGRNAFYKWIHDSLAADKPYNQMATEMIAAQGNNSFDQTNGQINYLPLGVVTGGPRRNLRFADRERGRRVPRHRARELPALPQRPRPSGHAEPLGKPDHARPGVGTFRLHGATWTRSLNLPLDPNNPQSRPITTTGRSTNTRPITQLNTTTGNRPARQPIGTVKTITPAYLFTGAKPPSGAGLSRRAGQIRHRRFPVRPRRRELHLGAVLRRGHRRSAGSVRSRPARSQQSSARPLDAAADQCATPECAGAVFHRQRLQRESADAADREFGYLSARFGLQRHLGPRVGQVFRPQVRAPAVERRSARFHRDRHQHPARPTQSPASRNDSRSTAPTPPASAKSRYAMQAPDVVNMPDGGGAVSQFLDTFLRGNRDDQPRKGEGSILQALGLMNDNFVESRIHATGTGATASFLQNLLTHATPTTCS